MSPLDSFDDGHTIKLGGSAGPVSGRVLSPGQIVGGTYRLKALLGRGGMGYVFCAEHTMIGKDYALKILAPEMLNEASRRRFETEGRAIANLDHVNIVKVYNMGIEDGDCPFYVMDLLDGVSLADSIAPGSGLKYSDCLDIFIQIAAGLDYAHGKGIIHRDVKPSNIILLARTGGSRLVKIVDFGIAKLLQTADVQLQSQTAVGEIFGSPFYMSPEQCLGDTIDARSDIYSLGCSLFETLCGKPPFCGQNSLDTMMMHQNKDIPSAVAALPAASLPQSVDTMLSKMMAKRPSDRHQSMKQVIHDLERLKEGKVIGKSVSGASPLSAASSAALYEGGVDLRRNNASGQRRGSNGIASSDTVEESVEAGADAPKDRGNRVFLVGALSLVLVAGVSGLCWSGYCALSTKSQNQSLAVSGQKAAITASKPVVHDDSAGLDLSLDMVESSPGLRQQKASNLSPAELKQAREAFKRCPKIFSQTVQREGRSYREFHFPDSLIGKITNTRSKVRINDVPARGLLALPPGVPLELEVRASEGAAVDLSEVFSTIGPGEFSAFSITGRRTVDKNGVSMPLPSDVAHIARILAIVSGWPKLLNLSISTTSLTDSMLDAMERMKVLDRLELHKLSTDKVNCGHRHFWSQLTELQLDTMENADQIVHLLAGSTKLEKLKIDHLHVSPDAIMALRSCPTLLAVELSKIKIDDSLVEAIVQLPKLTQVNIASTSVTHRQLAILNGCAHITKIVLSKADNSQQELDQFKKDFDKVGLHDN